MIASLLGCWKFNGSQMTDTEGNSLLDPLNKAQGLIIYTPGYMAVQLSLRGDSLSEEIVMESDYISYYGSYAFDASMQIVIHHVQSSSILSMVGKSLPRKVKEISKNRISLVIPILIIDRS
jgi:hypothetical protein